MGASLHVSLPDEMRRFVDEISNGKSVYATPSEYVRALIRKDMDQQMEFERIILQGLDDVNQGRLVPGEEFMESLIAEFSPKDSDS
jgi:antitoxin ParD1/3/4